MSRYAEVRVGTIYLTSDGTAAGVPCKIQVENESAFASPYAVAHTLALSFDVHTQVGEREVKGIEFAVLLDYSSETVLSDLVASLNTAIGEGAGLRIVCESLTDFDVIARPVYQGQQLFTHQARSGGIAKTVRINFISTGAGA